MVAWGLNGDTPGKFERIVDSLNSPSKEAIAVYGSLLAGMGGQEELGIGEQLRFVGPCEIRGSLFDLGEYPGLLLGSGVVHAELYEIADAAALPRLDEFELYDPDDPAGSLYIRKRARLTQPDRDAWLYEYNRDVSGMSSIPSGDWKSHCRERRSATTNAT
jgi:gamma-glutamylcyclotransferase (GGCT)/AIG2-like uncharacterized protein YtfP